MDDDLAKVARSWTDLGRRDPMWAALTNSGRGGEWDPEKFVGTGVAEVSSVLDVLRRRGMLLGKDLALDFGCGPGRLTAGLAACGFEKVIGLDVSPTMLAKAREILPADFEGNCEFRLNTGSRLDGVATGSVDLVYTCRVLQHMPSALARGYVSEFLRVVSPEGAVVFQLPAGPARNLAGTALRVLPQPLLDRLRRGIQMHAASPVEVIGWVADAGGVTASVEPDMSAGPRWSSYLYVVRRRG